MMVSRTCVGRMDGWMDGRMPGCCLTHVYPLSRACPCCLSVSVARVLYATKAAATDAFPRQPHQPQMVCVDIKCLLRRHSAIPSVSSVCLHAETCWAQWSSEHQEGGGREKRRSQKLGRNKLQQFFDRRRFWVLKISIFTLKSPK